MHINIHRVINSKSAFRASNLSNYRHRQSLMFLLRPKEPGFVTGINAVILYRKESPRLEDLRASRTEIDRMT